VAANAAGQFVVAWQPNPSSQSKFGPARIQAFSDLKTPTSSVISVGTQVFGNLSVAMDKDGDFAVAWRDGTIVQEPDWRYYDAPYPASSGAVYVQKFSSTGVALGAPVSVAPVYEGLTAANGSWPQWSGTAESLSPPQVAMDDDGDVAVGWTDVTQSASYDWYGGAYSKSNSKSYVEVYAADGSVLMPLTQVETAISHGWVWKLWGFSNVDARILKGIAFNANRELAFVYDNYYLHVPETPFARYYRSPTASGKKINFDALAGKTVASNEFGMDATGNLTIGWTTTDGLSAVRYAASGKQLGSVIGPIGHDGTPCTSTLSVGPSGTLAVTWGILRGVDLFGTGKPSPSCGKMAEFLKADGTAIGAPMVIENGTDELNGADMATAFDGTGKIVTIWSTTQADHSTELMGAAVSAP
jgi:hypothetical protein